jgi:xanthine dehydrogenase accessory factor
MHSELLAAINEERHARRAFVVVTDVGSGAQRLVRAAEIAADPLADVLSEQLRIGKSGIVEAAGTSLFLSVQVPPIRFIAIGGVHISQALAPMAKLVGLDMTIIDPRTAFAAPERFPDVAVIAEWPQDALPRLGLDSYTGMALLTHDPKIDDPGLHAALAADCFYIGALGSRKTHAKRLERLRAAGFSEAQIERIHAPIGLDIGAVSPAEIAVSILGELIAALRKKPLRSEKAA